MKYNLPLINISVPESRRSLILFNKGPTKFVTFVHEIDLKCPPQLVFHTKTKHHTSVLCPRPLGKMFTQCGPNFFNFPKALNGV